MRKRLVQTLRKFPWAPLVCFGLAYLLMQTEFMKQLALRTLDWRTNFRAQFQAPADPRIAIILFEDDTENNLVSWPPDRAFHGALVEMLALTKAAVVSWDVILDASREGDGDEKMGLGVKAAMDSGTQVITGSVTSPDPVETVAGAGGPTRPLTDVTGDIARLYHDAYMIIPFPQLRAASFYGFVDAPRGGDGIIREVPLVVRVGQEVYPSLSLQTLMAYFHIPADKVKVRLGDGIYLPTKEGEIRVPVSDEGKYFVNYRYDHDDLRPDFQTRSYREVLLKLNAHYVERLPDAPDPPDYAGKIVFIGQTVVGKADAGPTPRSAYSPLVLVHANVVNNILTQDFAKRLPDSVTWLGMLAVAYLCVWLATESITLAALAAVLVFAAYASLSFWGWMLWSLRFPLIGPLLGFMATQFITIGRRVLEEQRAKQQIKGMFGSYVSPEVVEQLVNAGEPPRLGGHQAEITAYFSDIEGFSTFSEKMPPDRLVELMNEYLTACTDIVQAEGGTLDKYIGDAMVAMFGAPVPLPEHAYRACVTALRVQARVGELREKWRGEGDRWPEIVRRMRTRIGLNTGTCIVGNMGSRTRFNYTMMGDDVNLAARMESGAKAWGVYSMCTEATKLACERHGGSQVVFRPLGRIVVKGRAQATPIYELMGLKPDLAADAWAGVELFAQGLEKYYQRDWDAASAFFKRSAAAERGTEGGAVDFRINPSLVYLNAMEGYRLSPPADDWDGVLVMKEK